MNLRSYWEASGARIEPANVFVVRSGDSDLFESSGIVAAFDFGRYNMLH